jgi:hypothetical protein
VSPPSSNFHSDRAHAEIFPFSGNLRGLISTASPAKQATASEGAIEKGIIQLLSHIREPTFGFRAISEVLLPSFGSPVSLTPPMRIIVKDGKPVDQQGKTERCRLYRVTCGDSPGAVPTKISFIDVTYLTLHHTQPS